MQASPAIITSLWDTRLRMRASNNTVHGYYIVRYERTDTAMALLIGAPHVSESKQVIVSAIVTLETRVIRFLHCILFALCVFRS